MDSYISRKLPRFPGPTVEADREQILWREHLRRLLDEYTFISESTTGLVG